MYTPQQVEGRRPPGDRSDPADPRQTSVATPPEKPRPTPGVSFPVLKLLLDVPFRRWLRSAILEPTRCAFRPEPPTRLRFCIALSTAEHESCFAVEGTTAQ